MAIRDIVSIGYGNGTFSPGVSKIVTLGYGIAEEVVPTTGEIGRPPGKRLIGVPGGRMTIGRAQLQTTIGRPEGSG